MSLKMPLLVKFVLKWTAIGVLGGWAVTVAFLVLDVGGIGSLLWRSSSAPLASLVLALSVASTAGPIAVGVAVMLRKDFGGAGLGNSRLERWKAGRSAELEVDRPLL
jgi:hypothetical protein